MMAGWLNKEQQRVILYLKEENRILKSHLKKELGNRRLLLSNKERRRLAELGKLLGRKVLKEVDSLFSPETILRWYRNLVAKKYDSSKTRKHSGRPRVTEEIEQLVVKIAVENPTYGYRKIEGALENLGHKIDKITVKNILDRHNMEPAPQRKRSGMSWNQFIFSHLEVLAATDFFTVDIATWHGVVTYYVLFVIHLGTRTVHIAGITENPNESFINQCARNLTNDFDGFLNGKRYLIHDRDSKYTDKFDSMIRDRGIEPIKLPARSPNLNAFSERFVLSIKTECLNFMIIFGYSGLWYVVNHYATHYHVERNHQGIGNRIIEPEDTVGEVDGEIARRDRLGGLLKYYYRKAA